jgi:hypothetical protein
MPSWAHLIFLRFCFRPRKDYTGYYDLDLGCQFVTLPNRVLDLSLLFFWRSCCSFDFLLWLAFKNTWVSFTYSILQQGSGIRPILFKFHRNSNILGSKMNLVIQNRLFFGIYLKPNLNWPKFVHFDCDPIFPEIESQNIVPQTLLVSTCDHVLYRRLTKGKSLYHPLTYGGWIT